MANTSLLQVRTSSEDKEKASEILEKLGTNLSAVVNMMIKQIILTESISFEVKINHSVYPAKMLDHIYCYPDSNVLKNKMGVRDSERLSQLE